MTTKTKAPYFSTTVEVNVDEDIEISPDDLHDGGWHHESECKGTDPAIAAGNVIGLTSYQDAIGSLHRQAHPSQPADPAVCREEPCRSIDVTHLIRRMGRP